MILKFRFLLRAIDGLNMRSPTRTRTIMVLFLPNTWHNHVQSIGTSPELTQLLLQLVPGVLVTRHCEELQDLVVLQQVVHSVEDILPIGKSAQVISLGSKIQDLLDLPLQVHIEGDLVLEPLRQGPHLLQLSNPQSQHSLLIPIPRSESIEGDIHVLDTFRKPVSGDVQRAASAAQLLDLSEEP